eukprot:TRINITY_DN113656_c0_g1_i1.p1 TRINITY_DN113656_c0_g1~~TRINITY_DN113656_c0_g1_i1.p1  ORF type:complete len:324 (-),score=31.58 TRINITY_DN113656_c0_g1_i1:22-993(-)
MSDTSASPRKSPERQAEALSPLKRRLQDIDAKVRAALTCGVCLELIVPPIQQCPEGHPICDDCLNNLPRSHGACICPTCRTKYPAKRLRNLVADEVAQCIAYPCPFKSCGCTETMPPGDLKSHAVVCLCNPDVMRCPIDSCGWKGLASVFAVHISQAANLAGTDTADMALWMRHSNASYMMSRVSRTKNSVSSTSQVWLDGLTEDKKLHHNGPIILEFQRHIIIADAELKEGVLKLGLHWASKPDKSSSCRFSIVVEDASENSLRREGPVSKLATSHSDMIEGAMALSMDLDTARSFSVEQKSHGGHRSHVLTVSYAISGISD